jgi:hypothetical protein
VPPARGIGRKCLAGQEIRIATNLPGPGIGLAACRSVQPSGFGSKTFVRVATSCHNDACGTCGMASRAPLPHCRRPSVAYVLAAIATRRALDQACGPPIGVRIHLASPRPPKKRRDKVECPLCPPRENVECPLCPSVSGSQNKLVSGMVRPSSDFHEPTTRDKHTERTSVPRLTCTGSPFLVTLLFLTAEFCNWDSAFRSYWPSPLRSASGRSIG